MKAVTQFPAIDPPRDLSDEIEIIQIAFVARGLSFKHDRVTDWYRRWASKAQWTGFPWPPAALAELAKRLAPITLVEIRTYLHLTHHRFYRLPTQTSTPLDPPQIS